MRILLLTISILLTTYLNGQSKKDYKRILKEEITIKDINENRDEFDYNFRTIVYYNFDDIDYQIFMGPKADFPVFAMRVLSIKTNPQTMDEKFTYEDLLNELKTFKDSDEYPELRKIVIARNKIAVEHASIESWETDKKILEQMGFNKSQINDIYLVVEVNQGKPYPEIFAKYLNSQQLTQTNNKKTDSENEVKSEHISIKDVYAYKNYDLGFKKAKEINKSILLFFGGRACINSRKMESQFFMDKEITDYINQNLIVICLYSDDRTKLKKDEIRYSEILKRELKIVAHRNWEIQKQYDDSGSQPLFILLENNNKELARIGFTDDRDIFMKFLNTK